ncbi:hypothetical protein SDRG_00853 [Saprolegnia diclina VS20]|uniref:Uncharacterized protein n=1 Tax=Saprolegnia diclina (strain VS20) TaxID=1156394 RepID=T0SGH8_SAPDV|nr:hypothetical protein SDRG_00853 [Saprolegnia diclina VS20]EQC42007.1 hypothetical protein SDRG_00853 [Saprolegnia diclina VS20]|eukprot:XP_008604576.1 hypothetical protein SDRG_00853 [Saprolegnia diclina VS20]
MTGPQPEVLRPRTVASPIRIEGNMHDLSLSGVRSKLSLEKPTPKPKPVAERTLLPRDAKQLRPRISMDVTVGTMLKTIQCLKQAPSTDELRREDSNNDARVKATDEERLKLRFKTMRMNKVFVTSVKKTPTDAPPFQVVQMAKPAIMNSSRPPSRASVSRSSSRAGRSNQCGILLTDDEFPAPAPPTPVVTRKQSFRDFELISQEAGDKVIFRALEEKRGPDVHDGSTFEFTRWDRNEW